MSGMRNATLTERTAFLLALFARNDMFHGSYIVEKVQTALAEGVRPTTLEALLDEENRQRYKLALKANARRWAWERAWEDTDDAP